ncbi:hypothetical protein CKM354_000587300 [Cercospora kikuchii]|uniref:Zn(2)-C6 fungal-type domain-containing protein n=1 Tax=Cercospora kikuchii TaxID=84275 RepID=A0A9P3CQI1_9PEZI|nr:uncharacterized protein CKM354_000587300 [Cercospora kikuchii]GIZ42613.1 hypothetical protein CKM354_000587300 [Cercospora kikuchii]
MPSGSGPGSKKREREDTVSEGPPDTPERDSVSGAAGSPSTTTTPGNTSAGGGIGVGSGNSTTNFRNVSACNRCRNRKNRCDQKLPKCTNCLKANVRCVGFDPVSKREIPRSYVYYLETRVRNLEALLDSHGVAYPPPSQDFAISETIKPGINVPFPVQEEASPHSAQPADAPPVQSTLDPVLREEEDGERLEKLVNDVGMVSVQGAGDARMLGSTTSGISFARVVFAAVKRSVNQTPTPSEKGGGKSRKMSLSEAAGGATTMRDSFFGLHTKPTIKPAPFPERELGLRLTELYFEHANPQNPVLHRGEFMTLFDRVYATDAKKRTPRELYMLNIVFAIGSGIIVDASNIEQSVAATEPADESGPPNKKRQRMTNQQHQPEEYHSSAIIHLESFLGSASASEGVGGGLEELQAVLLLAGLALLRPVAPGLWYIIGVAVRLSIDLGLHFEEIDHDLDNRATHPDVDMSNDSFGRKQWTRDVRRRLWWCVFNLDRLVSSCVGRPVSVNEAVVTTEFPSMLDDKYITPSGFYKPPNYAERPSYKLITRHYIRLRLLQSEILQVLQQRQADQARRLGANAGNDYILSGLGSPFLQPFHSFRDWRANIDRRLLEWKESSPQQYDTGVSFNPLFLDLNYWQAVIMLYRQSLSVPEQLASELSPATGEDVQSPGSVNFELEEDKQMVFMKVAEAGQMVLRIYRQLHRLKLVNYTFLATHHLFMSGISFLYAIWHSTLVRSQMTIDDVDFTVLAATSVLSDLIPMCPPAEACRDAFVRMSKATISMVMSTTGFGNRSTWGTQSLNNPEGYFGGGNPAVKQEARTPHQSRRQLPKFDMNLRDLFSEEEIASRPLHHQPKLQGFLRHIPKQPPISPQLPTNTSPRASTEANATQPTQQLQTLPQASPPLPVSSSSASLRPPSRNQQPQQPAYQQASPFVDNSASAGANASEPDYSFDNLDFLNDFALTEPGNTGSNGGASFWGQSHAGDGTDLGFNGGVANGGFADDSGAWEASGEVFDAFFFGSGSGGASAY